MKKTTKTTYGLKTGLSLSVALTALTAGAGFTAMAQDEAEDEAKRLNTVTITATKREQTLQDVPVAVSVVDESVIEQAEILDLNDLQSVVPSLGFRTFQNSANANFTIRGFGNGANNIGIEPSVGIFIDGVYRSRAAASIGDLPNIERVEVLRGPQSTLFGKNASAGVVSVVTKKPSYDFGGSVEASIGNLDLRRARGYFTGPITDNVAFSIGGGINQRDGTATNLVDGADLNTRDRWNVRGELLIEPTDRQEWRLILDADEIDEVCCVAANLIDGPTGDIVRLIGGNVDSGTPFAREVYVNGTPNNTLENRGISLQGDIEFDGFTLTTITSYRESDRDNNYDIDFTSAALADLSENVALETFTQEIRLTSNDAGQFDWMVGGFFFDESAEVNNTLAYGADFRNFIDLGAAFGAAAPADIPGIIAAFQAGVLPSPLAGLEGPLGLPAGTLAGAGQGNVEQFTQDDQAISLFGTVDWHINDRLTASLGLNYTENEKDASLNIQSTDVLSSLDLTQIGYALTVDTILGLNGVDTSNPAAIGAFIGGNPALYAGIQQQALAIASNYDTSTPAATQNPLGALRPLQFQPPFVNFPNAVEDGSVDADDLTYSLRLAYDLTDNINVYGSYATGFKSNSFNLSRDSRPFAAVFIPAIDPITQQAVGTVVDPFTSQVLRTAPSSPLQDAGLAQPNLITGTRFADPEEAEVFEIGLKGAWSNFAINLAIFDQSIDNFQANPFTGTGFVLLNAEQQSATGLEIDGSWSPTDYLTFTFAGTFLDPTYDTFTAGENVNADGSRTPADNSGTQVSGVSDVITSTSVLYEFDAFANWSGFFRADWQYESDSDFFDGEGNSPANALLGNRFDREVDIWNASLGFTSENGLGVTLWGRNIFDHEYITTAFPGVAQAGTFSGYPSQPQTYGVTVRKTF
ncbi:MAG: TonB-dependent receptor [Pseudomonadota bacterium]